MRRAAAAGGGPAGALKLHTSDRLRSSVRGVAGAPSGTRKPRLRRRRCVAGATVPTKHQRRCLPAEQPIQRSGLQEEAFHDGCFRHLRARAPLRPHTHRAIASYLSFTCYDMATYPCIYVYDAPGINPFSDISFGMCWCLMSWVQQVHNAAVVARSLGCQCDTEMPTGRTLTET